MDINLDGKIALVTGASRGIGYSIAKALGRAGASVAIHCHANLQHAQGLKDEIGNGAEVFQADLSDTGECLSLCQAIIQQYGKLDILVNNAGIAMGSPLEGVTEDWLRDWNLTMQVNLTASALLIREFLPHFKAGGGARIINIASRAAFRGDTADYLAYAASKGGLVSLSRSVARAFGKDGIVSFLVAPGFTRTEMAQQFMDQYGEEYAMNDIALAKLTEPEDIAPTVLFLASGLMDHATGCTIDLNAGSYVH
jgi:NAD(P)-dependent dehydrogenase (short-subunit alcohol dehydrogenase family)